jgi:hypothetical protein
MSREKEKINRLFDHHQPLSVDRLKVLFLVPYESLERNKQLLQRILPIICHDMTM